MTRRRRGADANGLNPEAPQAQGAARKLNPMNPFAGKAGFFNRLNRIVYTFAGPAHVGIGRAEEPFVPNADPLCPLCGQPMKAHAIDRSGERTRLHCPVTAADPS
jgi:hypothetical protein